MEYLLYNSNTTTIIQNAFELKKGSRFFYEKIEYGVIDIRKTTEEDVIAHCVNIDDNTIINESIQYYENYDDYKSRFFSLFSYNGFILDEQSLSEKDLTEAFCKLFEKDFEIKKDVWGIHYTGKKVCLDLMLIPKDTSQLRNKKITIGIEVKNPFTYGSNGRRNSDLFAQCLDYAQSKFDNYEDVIILICPILHNFENEIRLSRFLSRFNVGHVKLYKDSFYFKLGQEAFWSNEKGFISNARKSMMKLKIGNRSSKK